MTLDLSSISDLAFGWSWSDCSFLDALLFLESSYLSPVLIGPFTFNVSSFCNLSFFQPFLYSIVIFFCVTINYQRHYLSCYMARILSVLSRPFLLSEAFSASACRNMKHMIFPNFCFKPPYKY